MLPADLYIALRQLLDLTDDELLDGFAAGATRLLAGDASPALLAALDQPADAAAAAQAVTRARLQAWRKRGRQMTWPELRVLLLGLRDVVLPERDRS